MGGSSSEVTVVGISGEVSRDSFMDVLPRSLLKDCGFCVLPSWSQSSC
jgi:hypothetical protein